MPIYEYRCESCGHTLDALQKVSDAPLGECPECGEPALKRLISAPAFRLKGSGWYETDFKSDKEKKRNLVDGKSGGDGSAASGDGKSGESKSGESKSGDSKSGDAAKSGSGAGSSDGSAAAKSGTAAKPTGGSASA